MEKARYLLIIMFVFCCITQQAQTIVMTYNIRNSNAQDGINKWKNRKERLAEVITKGNPDIIGLQEVLQTQKKYLSKTLSAYRVAGVGRNNGKNAGEHSNILFKAERYDLQKQGDFWLSETPEEAGSKSWDAAITRICSWVVLKEKETGKEIAVFNTHFDHRGEKAREESAKLILRKIGEIAQGKPTILMGDFNLRPESEGYKTLTQNTGFTDAYEVTAPNYTACGFAVSNKNCSRIDYIFYSKEFKHKGYKLHTDNNGINYPSDHLAVSAELE